RDAWWTPVPCYCWHGSAIDRDRLCNRYRLWRSRKLLRIQRCGDARKVAQSQGCRLARHRLSLDARLRLVARAERDLLQEDRRHEGENQRDPRDEEERGDGAREALANRLHDLTEDLLPLRAERGERLVNFCGRVGGE